MPLTKEQFALSDEDLEEINKALANMQEQYFADDPDEDPSTSLDVTFCFELGFDRSTRLSLRGLTEIEVE